MQTMTQTLQAVVPHAGDVDRNNEGLTAEQTEREVVPHAGDVDRNVYTAGKTVQVDSRPPRGGRG